MTYTAASGKSFSAVITVLSSKQAYFHPELDAKCIITRARKARSNDLYSEKKRERKREVEMKERGGWGG